jgi:hypothetical protein
VSDLIPKAADGGKYLANVFRKFDVPNDQPVVVLQGELSGNTVAFSEDGWTGTIAGGHFKASKGEDAFDLQRITRTPPSLGAKPPTGAIVLFDGTNMDAWAKMKERDWLKEDGPAQWHLVPGGAMEVVPRSDGKKIANPRATLLLNGTVLYDDRELGPVTLNAARLEEAPTGPIQLQEHGMPVQFRNIWVVETGQ